MLKIAFLSFDWDYEIISEYYRGMDSFVHETEGLQVVIFSAFGHHHQRFEAEVGAFAVFDLCDLARYDGLVVQGNRTWPPEMRQRVVDEARRLGKPVISINYDLEGAHTVGTDNYAAMRGLIERVYADRQFSHPAFVNGLASSVEAQARAEAYWDACAELKIEDPRFYQANWQIEEGRVVAQRLLDEGTELPDAIFCCNDDIAIGVMGTLQAAGVVVPDEVMITGFDNREISLNTAPAVTTVDRDYAAVGKTALESIVALIEGKELPSKIYGPVRYCLRGSCGYESVTVAGNEKNLYTLGNRLKRFYEVLNNFQSAVYGADSLGSIAQVCEDFAGQVLCSHAFLTINDAYLNPERGNIPTSYHPLSHLMGWYGAGKDNACNSYHVYRIFPTLSILPADLIRDGLYVVYPLRRQDVCIGTVVTEGLTPIMRDGFLTICITLLGAGITSMHAMDLLREANSRLDDLYVHDELTGLFNRFGLERFGRAAYRHLLRDFDAAQLTFVDVDNMKSINDSFGHEQGDGALRDVADVIRRSMTGENAFAMRYGGDEFLIISRRNLVNRIEEQLALYKQSMARPYDIGLSIGVVEVRAGDRLGMEEAIGRADREMYEIKRKRKVGRN